MKTETELEEKNNNLHHITEKEFNHQSHLLLITMSFMAYITEK